MCRGPSPLDQLQPARVRGATRQTKLWRTTLDEVQDAFLDGRFGLQQKNKLRPIDNFSASQVNGATDLQDKFVEDAVDEIYSMINAWIQDQAMDLSYDMRKAHRQIAIRKAH